MRFRRLELRKFGSFTGESLDFGDRQPDFHVVFGPNEAGKSTTLRAIKGFLYGIPHVSRDVYLHGGELRISALLQGEDDEVLLTRRKGRKATLLDASNEPVPEERLKALLHGVDSEIYSALFGLDHVSLREGGAALARGEGQLGETLYAAGIGSGGVREVLAKLRAEAEALYLPRGKRSINQLVTRYQDAKTQLRLATTEPESWLRQRDEVERQRGEVERLRQCVGDLRLEESRLKQLQHLGHIAARYAALQRELAELGDALELPASFQEERERWTLQHTTSQREARRRRLELESARRELEALGEPGELAREFDPAELEYLDNALGSHRKAVVDLPRRRGELQAIEAEIRQATEGLGLAIESALESGSELAPLMPGAALRAQLADLIEQRTRLEVTLRQQREELLEIDARLESVAARLAERPVQRESAGLLHALEVAADEQRAESRLAELGDQVAALTAELEHAGRRLGIESLGDVALPSRDRIERFLRERRLEERALLSSEETVTRLSEERQQMEQQLTALQSAKELLELEQLTGARAARDANWGTLDDALRTGSIPAPERIRAFEASVRQVDTIADGLLADAERVSLGAQLRRRAEVLAEAEAGAQARVVEQRSRSNATQAAFGSEFPVLADADGDELLGRFEALVRAQGAAQRLGQLQAEVERLSRGVAMAKEALRRRLEEFGVTSKAESLSELSKLGQAVVGKLTEASIEARGDAQRQAELRERRAVRADLLAHAEEEHRAWSTSWASALQGLGLSPETPSRVVNARLESFTQLERLIDKRASLAGRIAGMQRDATQLSDWLRERIERFAPDLELSDVARAGAELKRRYQTELGRAERHALLQTQVERLQQELTQCELDTAEAERELQRLCGLARVEEPGELLGAEQRAAQQRRVRGVLQERQRELLEGAAGTWEGLPEILQAVREVSPQSIAVRLSQLESELIELDESYRDAISDLERKRAGLERLSTGSAATRREEQAEVLAELRREVVRYRRVKLAELILAQEVECYRKENQGPILERANQLFPALTLGRYRELSVGFDSEDRAVLEAIPSAARGEEERVRVDDLSDGARDQLFLALRIASIERYVAAGAVLPVVLDDILVHFDEERSRAALLALTALAERTQVLFFTHHRRHVELCEAALGGRFTLHELRRQAA